MIHKQNAVGSLYSTEQANAGRQANAGSYLKKLLLTWYPNILLRLTHREKKLMLHNDSMQVVRKTSKYVCCLMLWFTQLCVVT